MLLFSILQQYHFCSPVTIYCINLSVLLNVNAKEKCHADITHYY